MTKAEKKHLTRIINRVNLTSDKLASLLSLADDQLYLVNDAVGELIDWADDQAQDKLQKAKKG
jgi:hypothetical protein